MTAATVEAKARLLLEAGNVEVVAVRPRGGSALVTDDGALRVVAWRHGRRWACSCPAPAEMTCCHIAAAQLAVLGRLPPSEVLWSDIHGWQARARQAP